LNGFGATGYILDELETFARDGFDELPVHANKAMFTTGKVMFDQFKWTLCTLLKGDTFYKKVGVIGRAIGL
jgi:hypothetical protein